jgi:hypothetical protein
LKWCQIQEGREGEIMGEQFERRRRVKERENGGRVKWNPMEGELSWRVSVMRPKKLMKEGEVLHQLLQYSSYSEGGRVAHSVSLFGSDMEVRIR